MPKAKAKTSDFDSSQKTRPALTPEGRENQLIAKAINLAEKQLDEGTASSQVITHFLKLGTENAKLEREKLRHENELLKAKTEMIESSKHAEELFEKALKAMSDYRGSDSSDEEYDYEYYED